MGAAHWRAVFHHNLASLSLESRWDSLSCAMTSHTPLYLCSTSKTYHMATDRLFPPTFLCLFISCYADNIGCRGPLSVFYVFLYSMPALLQPNAPGWARLLLLSLGGFFELRCRSSAFYSRRLARYAGTLDMMRLAGSAFNACSFICSMSD
jgi:hypothetical protein